MTLKNKIQEILKFICVVHELNFSEKEKEQIFSVMLTPSEIEVLSQRIRVLELLHEGKSQRDVSDQLGVGVATATRGNRMLKENTELLSKILKKGSSCS